jgi:competence protein ComEC
VGRKALAERGGETGLLEAVAGQRILLGDGVSLLVVHPPDDLPPWTPNPLNNSSVVLLLTYGDVSFLLTGDIEAAVEEALVEGGAPLQATVLKVAHHGSKSSTVQGFLDAVSPALAVISVGSENRFGHPDKGVMQRLRAATGGRVALTSELGDIELTTDGRRLWLDTERGGG